jgi:hypothetical protein
MTYSSHIGDAHRFSAPARAMGWAEATRKFLFTREGGLLAGKLLVMAGLIGSIADEPLDLIPGIDLLSFGDDILWLAIPAYAVGRIAWIRHRANNPKRARQRPAR